MVTSEQIFKEAISLNPIEQARLVDNLLSNLDKPDANLDRLWAKEAESRLSAFKNGELKAVPIVEVVAKHKCK